MVQEMAKQLAEVIKDKERVLVQAEKQDLKADKCLYTEDFLKEALNVETLKKLSQSMWVC